MGNYAVELHTLFSKEKILDLMTISQSFPERSRTSLVRDLQKVNAISSYNHCGKHYTLKEIADFNDQGIWQYKDAMFSAHGNLKHTIQSIVNNSSSGMTHNDLKAILKLRTHDILRELVQDNKIAREDVNDIYVYVSADSGIRLKQIGTRMRRGSVAHNDPMFIVEVLSYVIQEPHVTVTDLYSHFKNTGASQSEVEEIFRRYVQGKKN